MKSILTVLFLGLIVSTSLAQVNYRFRNAHQMAMNSRNAIYSGSAGLLGNPASLLSDTLSLSVQSEQRFGTDILAGSIAFATPLLENQSIGLMVGSYGVEGFRNNQLSIAYARSLTGKLDLGLQVNLRDLRIDRIEQQWSTTANLGLNYSFSNQTTLMAGANQLFSSRRDESTWFIGLQHIISHRFMAMSELSQDENDQLSLSLAGTYDLNQKLAIYLSIKTTTERFGYGVSLQVIPEIELMLGANHHPILGESFGISAIYSRKSP